MTSTESCRKGSKPTLETRNAFAALAVIVLSDSAREALYNHDPKALKQCEAAYNGLLALYGDAVTR